MRLDNSSFSLIHSEPDNPNITGTFPLVKTTRAVHINNKLAYTELFFYYDETNGKPNPFPPIKSPPFSFPFKSITAPLRLQSSYLGVPANFSYDIPLLKVVDEKASSTKASETKRDCEDKGGVFDKEELICFSFFKLQDVCLALLMVGGQWQVADDPGCLYDFTSPGIYDR